MKKKIFHFRRPCDGSSGPLYWISEDGTFGSYSNDARTQEFVEFTRLAIEAERDFSDHYAHLGFYWDSEYADTLLALAVITAV